MALLLHGGPNNKNTLKALVTAEYVGVKIDLVPHFVKGVTNKTREFLKLNPLGKVPVLETPDGPIFESNAIARYVARRNKSSLLGGCLFDLGLVDQWIDFATSEIDANFVRWFLPSMGSAPYIQEVEKDAIEKLKKALGVLNTFLASNTYLVGQCVTLADIVMICNLLIGFTVCFTKEFSLEFPHVGRYFWTLVNQPHFKKHLVGLRQAYEAPSLPTNSH